MVKKYSNDNEFDNHLKENEIQRLIDSEGKKEPITGVLSDEEILKYAANSKAAASIRLKNGRDRLSDKLIIHKRIIIGIFILLIVPFILSYNSARSGDMFSSVVFLVILLAFIDYPLYFLYIKNYQETSIKKEEINKDISIPKKSNNEKTEIVPSLNVYKSQISDLKSLYEVKEKIAKELIEKRFAPPQITYDRFISAVDNCTLLFNNQVDVAMDIINLATEHTPKIDYEIESRINVLSSIIEKIDSLTNELVINIGDSESETDENIEILLEDMENLIDSVDEYE